MAKIAVVTIPKIVHVAPGSFGYRYMQNSINYVANGVKTETKSNNYEVRFCSGINCSDEADETYRDFKALQEQFEKTSGRGNERLIYHYVQSFAPGETTPEVAHTIGLDFLERSFDGKYQIFMGTHIDKGHIHNHILINSVAIEGKHYRAPPWELPRLRSISDELCREYELSVIDPNDSPEYPFKNYKEWLDEGDAASGKLNVPEAIKRDVREMLKQSVSLEDFKRNMESIGYEVKIQNEHIAVRSSDMQKFRRLDTLFKDEMYKPENLRRFLLSPQHQDTAYTYTQKDRTPTIPKQRLRVSRNAYKGVSKMVFTRVAYAFLPVPVKMLVHYANDIRRIKRILMYSTTYQPAYKRISYDKRINESLKRYEFVSTHKEDIMRSSGLTEYKTAINDELDALLSERKRIYRRIQREVNPEKRKHLCTQRDELSESIKDLRRDITFCDEIISERRKISGITPDKAIKNITKERLEI